MKKLVACALAASMMIPFMTGCGEDKGSGTDTLNLGLLAPLTGTVSDYGNAVKNGVELAVEEINAAGGVNGKQISLNTLDEKGDVTEAVTAYQKLMSEGMVALLGDVTTKPCMAVAEVAASDYTSGNGVPMLTPTGTGAAITGYGENVFRTCFIDPFQGRVMATFAKEDLGAQNVAVLYNTSDDYSDGLAQAFIEKAEELGMTVVATEAYGTDDKDFKSQLTKIQAANPDVLFVPDYYGTVSLIIQQAREIGFDKPMLGGDGWDGVIQTLGDKASVADNCYFACHYSVNDTDEKVASFVSSYREKYGSDPTSFAGLGYDSVYMMVQAIEKAGSTDAEAIVKALQELDYQGVTGNIKFDEQGDPIKKATIQKIENGQAVVADKVGDE